MTTAARQLLWVTYTVAVRDGQLTLDLHDLGGKDKSVALAALTIAAVDGAPAGRPEAQALALGGDSGHSSLQPEDVNQDGAVTALDVLLAINFLNGQSAFLTPQAPAAPALKLDVNGDDRITAVDALWIVNYLNRQAAGPAEGEARPARAAVISPLDLEDVLDDIAPAVERVWPHAFTLGASM